MKISLMLILAAVAFLYSTGCVAYELKTGQLPEAFMYPLYPGIWVGAQVWNEIGERLMLCYAAGIITMTLVGAGLGSLFDLLCGGRRSGAA